MKDSKTSRTRETEGTKTKQEPILKIWRMLNSDEQEAARDSVTELEREIGSAGADRHSQ